ncbi:MAG: sugar diacid recognition domain-containing protein [Eubacterium sp.]|nr:sugar diacid recognition domain-containing protein [Eubacterium sp.]
MMLDAKIAQKIADEVMNTLGYNINVMNKQGIIIGSGNKERIGTFHETAMRTIRDCAIYEVTQEESGHLEGVKPGINMPIVGRGGQVMGAVGITGRPDEVRNIGKLVKMTAELIIEQEESINNFYRHRNDKELFVTTLLSERSGMSSGEMAAWGSRMGYDMARSRVACILVPEAGCGSQGLEQMLERIKASAGHSKQDLSMVMGGAYLLVFKAVTGQTPWEIKETVEDYHASIAKSFEGKSVFSIYTGLFYPGIGGYRRSYEDALLLYKKGGDQGLHFSQDQLISKFYCSLDEERIAYMLKPYIQRLETAFGRGMAEAMITLRKLIENGFRYDRAAQELYVHRNTVIFRKKKIDDCLGSDPKADSNALVLAALLVEYYFDPGTEIKKM